jgi:hypothetical protein
MFDTRDERGNADSHAATPHFWQSHRAIGAIGFVFLADFTAANLGEWARQITIPLQRVYREVEVGIKYKRTSFHFRQIAPQVK